jgi:2-haloacid dehalogenase
MTVRAFLFDIGNVLIDWNPDNLLRKLLPDAAAIAEFRAKAVTQERILAMDRGQDWDTQLAEIAETAPEHLETARTYRARWVETVAGPIQETVDLMLALKHAGHPLYALSNYGVENFEKTVPVYPFLDAFDGRIVSGHEGVIKPEAEIFELARDRFALDPEATLFIDDRPENTEAAARLGFRTHVFTSPSAFSSELRDRGFVSR